MELSRRFRTVLDVSRWRLCVGCGACASVCESGNIVLTDVPAHGIRPVLKAQGPGCDGCGKCLEICPGVGSPHPPQRVQGEGYASLHDSWGTILEMWEGYACDPEIRYHGSSGGAATAIALHCLETGVAGGVYHVGSALDEPWRNRTVLSRNRGDMLSRAGSRYSPASPCDCLGAVASAAAPSVFIGKPCDVQGLRKAQLTRVGLKENVALALGIFCAGAPSTAGILSLMAKLGLDRREVKDIRFRGKGWPGSFSVQRQNCDDVACRMSYGESWGFLQAYRPFRCHLCPDGTSEFADISCGDPWYREPAAGDPGRSLILVRTERGREILKAAAEAGFLYMERVEPAVLESSQINLLMKRRAIWGRLIAMKGFGLPVPNYNGFPLFENWLELPWLERTRSVIGTARRILQRKYFKSDIES